MSTDTPRPVSERVHRQLVPGRRDRARYDRLITETTDSPETSAASMFPSSLAARRSTKVAESVMVNIVRLIVDEDLQQGDRLPNEAAMMQLYGVSRASLREAMRLLEVQGIVTLKPGPRGGAFVGRADHRNLARTITLHLHMAGLTYGELMDSQVTLEALHAESAARNPDAELRQRSLESYRHLPEVLDDITYRDAAMGFHAVVGQLAENRTIALLARAITHAVTMHVMSNMDVSALRQDILDEHVEIAEAIISGDTVGAYDATARHFRAQHDYFRERWPARLDDIVERP